MVSLLDVFMSTKVIDAAVVVVVNAAADNDVNTFKNRL